MVKRLQTWLFIGVACVCAQAMHMRAARAGAPSIGVSQGDPQFSSQQIVPGDSASANFDVAPAVGSPSAEAPPPSISKEVFTVNVDSATTIMGISANTSIQGVVTIAPGGHSATLAYSGSCPGAAMIVSAMVTSSTLGWHAVTLNANITDSDGLSASGGPVSESFDVVKLALNVYGQPYVIINNSPGGGSNIDSQYNAEVVGGSGDYTWSWSIPTSVVLDGGYLTSNPINVYGESPQGPATISCTGTDKTGGATAVGNRSVTVQNEWVWTEDPKSPIPGSPSNTSYLGTVAAGSNNSFVAGQIQYTAGQKFNYSASGTLGFQGSLAVSLEDLISEALDLSISGSYSYTATYTQAVTVTFTIPARSTYQLLLYKGLTIFYGTWQQWEPSGLESKGNWQNTQQAMNGNEDTPFLVYKVAPI